MKVLMINASPRMEGNTTIALNEMEKVFDAAGIQTDIVRIGNLDVRGCIACNYCKTHGKCVFNDIVNEIAPLFEEADGIVVGTPVYYASANGTVLSFLQRLFYSIPFDTRMKVGAGVACARRGGITATYDEINKFFGISGMPVASGQYWNGVHGAAPGDVKEDFEGLQQMRTTAKNMVYLMKAIEKQKEESGLPDKEEVIFTNFVR